MDIFKTQGAFSWNELMTPDPHSALRFYSTLLGWSVQPMPMPAGTYYMLKVGDASVGGVMALPAGATAGGLPAAWGSYVTVDDVDACAARVAGLGGKLIHGPSDIPAVGRIAVIADPQGATLTLITYAIPSA